MLRSGWKIVWFPIFLSIVTPWLKLSLHELRPGERKIKVVLAANDHSPLEPEETITVTIP